MLRQNSTPPTGSIFSTDSRGRLAIPPLPALIAVLAIVFGFVLINWPGFSGPAKDRHLNAALYQAAGRSFAPARLAEVTSLDVHQYRIRNFAGLEACPNLERLAIHPDSVDYWRRYADAQVPEANPQTPDVRPTLPLLPKLKEVVVGGP